MIKRVTVDYVKDILDAVDAAMQFVQNMTFAEFEKDRKTIFASSAMYKLLILSSKIVPLAG